jgi:hypothetical protein
MTGHLAVKNQAGRVHDKDVPLAGGARPGPAACVAVHDGIKPGRIAGYFGEAVVTLDVLWKVDKVAVVGGSRIASESRADGPYSLTISIGTRWPRRPLIKYP